MPATGDTVPGPRPGLTGPVRRCIVTRLSQPKAGLIRFVVGPDAQIVPDVAGRLPGRGFYVASERQTLELAVAKRAFNRAARQAVTVPAGLIDLLDRLLVQRVSDALALANRAGALVMGFEAVRDALADGTVAVLLTASDAAAHGADRLRRTAAGRPALLLPLTAADIGARLGKPQAVHLALAPGGLTDRLLSDMARLDGLRGILPPSPPADGWDDDLSAPDPDGNGAAP